MARKESNAVERYLQEVIYKSWTWNRLTQEEKQRFVNLDVFGQIKGRDEQRVEWLNTIYTAYITALGYKTVGWREPNPDDVPKF